MRCRGIVSLSIVLLAVLGFGLTAPTVAFAQATAGVIVDAEGVLRTKTAADANGQLTKERINAARAALNPKVAAYSRLRYVSLKHLEKAIEENHGAPTEEMLNLAGLLRLRYVFLYPESKDIVIAGPAEGWVTDGFGRFVGLKSGRPTILLQDLVVALRAFPPDGAATKFIGCSIDPTPEGLAAMQQFLRRTGSTFSAQDAANVSGRIIEGLQTSLGMQTISINGVSPRTHFALVLVEADYRMKLIGIGLEKPPVRMVSYVDRANPSMVSRNALQRWFFTPDYECVRTGDNGMAMELVGDGVKLVGENEVVGEEGQRKSDRANRHGQPDLRQGLYRQVFRTGRAFAGLRPTAKPHRPVDCRSIHPARGFLRQGGVENGPFRRRTAFRRGNLRYAETSRPGHQRDLEGEPLNDPHWGWRGDRAEPGVCQQAAFRRGPGDRQSSPTRKDRPGQGTVVVGLRTFWPKYPAEVGKEKELLPEAKNSCGQG